MAQQAYRIKRIAKNNQPEFDKWIADWRTLWIEQDYKLIGNARMHYNASGELTILQGMRIEGELVNYDLGFYRCRNCSTYFMLPLDHDSQTCNCGKEIY